MIVKIKIPDKDPVKMLDYFYYKCLDLYALDEINEFLVEIEGTELKKGKKQNANKNAE